MTALYEPISRCRACRSPTITPVLSLGELPLSGVFPTSRDEEVPRGPLALVRCGGACGLVQLAHDYDVGVLYGQRYGYRSGLNAAMVRHLRQTVDKLRTRVSLASGDVVLDVGSNDGTLLGSYPESLGVTLLGMDPTAARFASYYAPHTRAVAELFSAESFLRESRGKKARVVTSIAMFYDLPDPGRFVADIHDVLADDGVWHFEQSYLPLMLEMNAYDTICHEHLEYYALHPIVFLLERAGFRIEDVTLSDVNGGSFAVTAQKGKGDHAPVVARMLADEHARGLQTDAPFDAFAKATMGHRADVRALLESLHAQGKRVLGLGASTKGNVLLDHCGIGPELLPAIAEVNEEKVGAFTPGSKIPIVRESDLADEKPDYLFVLPWHFRAGFLKPGGVASRLGVPLIFPLPKLEVIAPEKAS